MTDDAMLAQTYEQQAEAMAICRLSLGLSSTEASAVVEPLGHFVELIRIGGDVALTLDMRGDRVRLFVNEDDVVARADVGLVSLPRPTTGPITQ